MDKLSKLGKRAVIKYGAQSCVDAFKMHHFQGYGASSIAFEGPISIKTTRQADAAINAGREIFNGADVSEFII